MTNSDHLLLLVAPLIGLATFAVTQISFNWITSGRQLLMGFVLGLLVGWIAQISCTAGALSSDEVTWSNRLGLGLVNQFTYLALADGYIHFVNIMICSLRLRVLHELLMTPQGLSEDGILERYNARDLVATRLERLRNSDRLGYVDGRYYTRFTNLLTLARLYRLLKIVMLGNPPTKMDSAADLAPLNHPQQQDSGTDLS